MQNKQNNYNKQQANFSATEKMDTSDSEWMFVPVILCEVNSGIYRSK